MLLFALLLACETPDQDGSDDTDDAVDTVDLLTELDAPGPWGVGYRASSVTYEPADGSGARTLRLAMWYPTDAVEGDEVRYMGIFQAPGVLDGPPAADGPFPLVVFSHGHQGYAESLGHVMSRLAGEGYVVVAPDHTGNTTFDSSVRLTPIYWQRAWDVSAVLDHVIGGGEPDLPALSGGVLGAGHSFGGYTMLALAGAAYDVATLDATCPGSGATDGVCSTWDAQASAIFSGGLRDERIDGVIAYAAGDFDRFGAAGVGAIAVPVLQETGGLDSGNAADAPRYWDALPAPSWRVHMAHATHLAWTDVAPGPTEDQPDILPAERAHRVADLSTGAFAAWLLRDRADATDLFDGTIPLDDDVETSVHAAP